ncbi:MAG TPA: DUF6092 family protein [Spirochaetota bacterium]|nr:DUF6092 family protein [Spirochaetota bacterium]
MGRSEGLNRGEWLELFCFMTTSARGLIGEPELYGPFRIIDSIEKIIELLENQKLLDDAFLKAEKEKIKEKKLTLVADGDAFITFLDELVMDFTKELKKETL